MSHEQGSSPAAEFVDCGIAPLTGTVPIPTVNNFKAAPGTSDPQSLTVWKADDDCPTQLVAPEGCDPTWDTIWDKNMVLGINSLNEVAWLRAQKRIVPFSAPTYNPAGNFSDVLLITADVALGALTQECAQLEIVIKNVDSVPHNVTGFIEGVIGNTITLVAINTPGLNSIHLYYDVVSTTWYIGSSHRT